MTELIVAMNKEGGIGFQGKIPWHCKDDLQLFKNKTVGKTLIMGRKTVENLPQLPGRNIICVSRSRLVNNINDIVDDLFDALRVYPEAIIAGGAEIYKLVLSQPDLVQTVHLSIINGEHTCDTYFDIAWLKDFVAVEHTVYEDFQHYVLKRSYHGERQYLDLLKSVTSHGVLKNGRNGPTISLFKNDMIFDLRNGFPLLTTKKMFLRGIVEEFLFFLRGDTDSTYLSNQGVRIWESNTSEEFIAGRSLPYAKGVLGPLYGYQWRFFNAEYIVGENGRPIAPVGGVDQLANVVRLIKTDPNSRRILLTAYNPAQAEQGVLYPCHSIIIQFYVQDDMLDMFCYNRSQDIFLGIPFNISSSSLLLMTVAKLTGKTPRFFHMTMGDTHIYTEHNEQVEEQMKRIPYSFPTLKLPDMMQSLDDIPNLKAADFILENYRSHPSIKAVMIA